MTLKNEEVCMIKIIETNQEKETFGVSFEALIALIALCDGAGYILGKDVNKARK